MTSVGDQISVVGGCVGGAPNIFHDSNHFYFHAVKVFLEAEVTFSDCLDFFTALRLLLGKSICQVSNSWAKQLSSLNGAVHHQN